MKTFHIQEDNYGRLFTVLRNLEVRDINYISVNSLYYIRADNRLMKALQKVPSIPDVRLINMSGLEKAIKAAKDLPSNETFKFYEVFTGGDTSSRPHVHITNRGNDKFDVEVFVRAGSENFLNNLLMQKIKAEDIIEVVDYFTALIILQDVERVSKVGKSIYYKNENLYIVNVNPNLNSFNVRKNTTVLATSVPVTAVVRFLKEVLKDVPTDSQQIKNLVDSITRNNSTYVGGIDPYYIAASVQLPVFAINIETNKLPYKITAEQAQSIINVAQPGCSWKTKLADKWAKDIVLNKEIDVLPDFRDEMYRACSAVQLKHLKTIFEPAVEKAGYEVGTILFAENDLFQIIEVIDQYSVRLKNLKGKTLVMSYTDLKAVKPLPANEMECKIFNITTEKILVKTSSSNGYVKIWEEKFKKDIIGPGRCAYIADVIPFPY